MQSDPTLTKQLPHLEDNWQGYTLDDLRYRRAYVAARRELEKERLYHNLHTARKNVGNTTGTMVKRVASTVPVIDYALMAFTIGSKAFKFLGKLRRSKKH